MAWHGMVWHHTTSAYSPVPALDFDVDYVLTFFLLVHAPIFLACDLRFRPFAMTD
jgi:hypothetical protein